MKSCISYIPFDIGSEKVVELRICRHSGTKGEVIHLMQTKSRSLSVLKEKKGYWEEVLTEHCEVSKTAPLPGTKC